jgi:hypothetical protein
MMTATRPPGRGHAVPVQDNMDESFLVLFFKKEQHSLFEKREPKTFVHACAAGAAVSR